MTVATIPLGQVAERLARLGLPVFPLQPGRKRPATINGLKSATIDRLKIARWWQAIPNANIGIATGGKSRVVVIDCDTDPKPWPENHGQRPSWANTGEDVLVKLAEQNNAIEDGSWLFNAPRVITPTGGVHLYYAIPRNTPIASSAGKLGAWLDVRGEGGYVVAPYSTLDDVDGLTPGHYRPANGFDLTVDATSALEFDDEGDLIVENITIRSMGFRVPRIPEWLAHQTSVNRNEPPDQWSALEQALNQTPSNSGRYAERALEGELETIRTSTQGTRNHTLNRSAYKIGTLIGAGLLNESSSTTALLNAAQLAGLTENEATTTIRSGLRAGTSNPRAIVL